MAEGTNIGLREAIRRKSKYVLAMNTDMEVKKNFLTVLVKAMEDHPEVAVSGPKINYMEPRNKIWCAGCKYRMWGYKPLKQGEIDDKKEEEKYVDGIDCTLMFRVKVLEKMGLLNPKLFIIQEFTGWCLKAAKAGHKCLYVPESIKEKYSKNKKIQIYGLMPSSKVINEIFPMADIFVYPGYSDTFGFAFIEALSFGLPIVTVEGFSRNFLVSDEKTGFIIKKEKDIDPEVLGKNEEIVITKMVGKTLRILKDKKLRRKMSQNCIEEVKNGKFSIKERNSKLKKIYEEAIR